MRKGLSTLPSICNTVYVTATPACLLCSVMLFKLRMVVSVSLARRRQCLNLKNLDSNGRDPVEATSKPASFRHSPSPQPLQCRDDCSCVCDYASPPTVVTASAQNRVLVSRRFLDPDGEGRPPLHGHRAQGGTSQPSAVGANSGALGIIGMIGIIGIIGMRRIIGMLGMI